MKPDRVRFATATTGTGAITPGAAISSLYLTPSDASLANNDKVVLLIQEDGDFELVEATYTTGPQALARDTVKVSKIGSVVGTTRMTLGGNAIVSIVEVGDDFRASEIAFLPAGDIAATDVQAAIEELDSGKLPLAGGTLTGDLILPGDPDSNLKAATRQYVDQIIAAQDAMVFRGVIDCSTNPNYPAADRGDTYRVSVAGKIGGGSGAGVEAGDLLLCLTDSTASGNHAAVGADWSIAQVNLDGAVIGPSSAVDDRIAVYDGATGALIKLGSHTIAGVRSRANHTGTQALSTISDAGDAASKNVGTGANDVAPGTAAFPSGTLMLFQQSTAPTGWTKQTAHNDKALRVVSGTAGSGGSWNFSTVFGKTATNSHTLSTSQIPAHDHDIKTTTRDKGSSGSNVSYITSGSNTKSTQNTGGGGSHSHVMDIRVRYVDLIIARKD
ncbi:MAG: hypothetical protein GY788_11875 [bacterium]|nr:hypothetical protein [bacterium]